MATNHIPSAAITGATGNRGPSCYANDNPAGTAPLRLRGASIRAAAGRSGMNPYATQTAEVQLDVEYRTYASFSAILAAAGGRGPNAYALASKRAIV